MAGEFKIGKFEKALAKVAPRLALKRVEDWASDRKNDHLVDMSDKHTARLAANGGSQEEQDKLAELIAGHPVFQ
jgi:hypothetical protein